LSRITNFIDMEAIAAAAFSRRKASHSQALDRTHRCAFAELEYPKAHPHERAFPAQRPD